MDISNPNPPAVNPWTLTPRTLTGFGPAVNANVSGSNLVASAGATVVFTGSGSMQIITVAAAANASVTWSFGVSISGLNIVGQVFAAATPALFTGVTIQSNGISLTNTGTVAGNYSFVGCRWTP